MSRQPVRFPKSLINCDQWSPAGEGCFLKALSNVEEHQTLSLSFGLISRSLLLGSSF